MSHLQLARLVKRYGQLEIIHGIDLEIEPGEFVVFVGPSGCGKSTLLRMIAGLEEISEGELIIDDELVNDVPAARRGIAMVFQSYALYPHMTVYKNLAFGLETARMPQAEIHERVTAAARILQIDQLLDRKPRALSGGQRQRVAIGRAIVREPKVFLFDEPLSNLDADLRVQMRVEIAKLHHRLGATMIYVTHDQVEAMTMATKIVVLRSGVIEQVGAPLELYNRPANRFVAGFIGSPRMNFLDARVVHTGPKGVSVALDTGARFDLAVSAGMVRPGEPVTLGIRPEHIHLGNGGPVEAEVTLTEHLGGETFVYAGLPDGGQLVVQAPGEAPIRIGDRLPLGFPAARCHLFDGKGRVLEPID